MVIFQQQRNASMNLFRVWHTNDWTYECVNKDSAILSKVLYFLLVLSGLSLSILAYF